MNTAFNIQEYNGISLLVYRPWWAEGIVHGMTLRDLDFGTGNLAAEVPRFTAAIGVNELVLPSQIHSAVVADLRDLSVLTRYHAEGRMPLNFEQCDAVVVRSEQGISGVRSAFGVRTADCVPLIVRAENGWGLIHAGWRGLATQIIENTLRLLDGVTDVAIFAGAGPRLYEVGAEVIEQIGESAVYTPLGDTPGSGTTKSLLDTTATAVRQVRALLPNVTVANAEVCSIEDERFHSFRRDGDSSGRCLTFVVPPSDGA